MPRIRSLFNVAILSVLLSSAPLALRSSPAQAQSLGANIPAEWTTDANFQPGDVGQPGGREGGAVRSTCTYGDTPLTVLVPENGLGKTTEPYPTFLAYIPRNIASSLEFTLETADGDELYKATFNSVQTSVPSDSDTETPKPDALAKTSTSPGIASLSLPANAALTPLEIGKDYRWRFTLKCGGVPIFARGWVRRVEKSADLVAKLAQASDRDRVNIYIEAGLWNDALATLDNLRRSEPDDRSITTALEDLLRAANLNKVVDAI